MLPVLQRHFPLLRRTLSILAGAGVRYTTGASVAALAATLLNPEWGQVVANVLGGTWVAFSRWWSLIPLGILSLLFVYGLMKANHEKFLEVEAERDDLKEKLKAYEDSGKPKVLVRLENGGPVTTEEWAPDEIGRVPSEVVCVVPYKPYDTVSAFFDDPATTIKVEDVEDAYHIFVDYEVRGEIAPRGEAWRTQIDAGVQVLSEDGEMVRGLHVYVGMAAVSEDGSWQHTVHGNGILSGLFEGVYGLNVLDYLEVPLDYRRDARREYRDMRLRVTRQ